MNKYQEYLLFTADLERAVADIESIGGAVTHRLGRRIIVVRLSSEADLDSIAGISREPPSDLSETENLVIGAWHAKSEKEEANELPESEGLKWDAPGYEPPEYDSPESES